LETPGSLESGSHGAGALKEPWILPQGTWMPKTARNSRKWGIVLMLRMRMRMCDEDKGVQWEWEYAMRMKMKMKMRTRICDENEDMWWERGCAMSIRMCDENEEIYNDKDGIADNDEEKVKMFAVARCYRA
jgi:hypothetical protein